MTTVVIFSKELTKLFSQEPLEIMTFVLKNQLLFAEQFEIVFSNRIWYIEYVQFRVDVPGGSFLVEIKSKTDKLSGTGATLQSAIVNCFVGMM